jgi:microcystin-dependent protein
MSYKSSSQQRSLKNVLYSNNTLTPLDLSGENLASIDYVNTNIQSIDLTTQQNELINLQNELNILIEKNKRIIGSITPSILVGSPSTNYLICDGQSILVSDYQELFSVIGYNYGGSGLNFSIPDFRSYFIVGGNNNINNLSFSNLFSGNNTTGATNNYLKFGSISTFPILSEVPNHTHSIVDNGHSHSLPTDLQPFSTIGETQYIKSANLGGSFNSANNTTGIIVLNSGNAIQTTDPYSGLNGVNYTPPWFSINFLICCR